MLRTIVRVLVMSPRPALVSTAALGLGLLLGIAAGATGAVQPERHAKHLVTNAFRGATAWEAPSAARGLVPASQADTAYTDPTGDATGGSPDVRATVVTNDATGIVTFRVAVAGVPAADTWSTSTSTLSQHVDRRRRRRRVQHLPSRLGHGNRRGPI